MTGARASQVLSCEITTFGCRPCPQMGKATSVASVCARMQPDPAQSETLSVYGTACQGTGRSRGRPWLVPGSARRILREYVLDVRAREVGPTHSTCEPPEQRRGARRTQLRPAPMRGRRRKRPRRPEESLTLRQPAVTRQRREWREGVGPTGTRTSKQGTAHSGGLAFNMRWLGYDRLHPFGVYVCTFDRRQEPGALVAHAGICAGGARQRASLPRRKRLINRQDGADERAAQRKE